MIHCSSVTKWFLSPKFGNYGNSRSALWFSHTHLLSNFLCSSKTSHIDTRLAFIAKESTSYIKVFLFLSPHLSLCRALSNIQWMKGNCSLFDSKRLPKWKRMTIHLLKISHTKKRIQNDHSHFIKFILYNDTRVRLRDTFTLASMNCNESGPL